MTHHLVSAHGAQRAGEHDVNLAEECRNAVEHAVAAGVAQGLNAVGEAAADVAVQECATWLR